MKRALSGVNNFGRKRARNSDDDSGDGGGGSDITTTTRSRRVGQIRSAFVGNPANNPVLTLSQLLGGSGGANSDDPGVPFDFDILVAPTLAEVDSEDSGEDEVQRINYTSLDMGVDQGPLLCFGCDHIGFGENIPGINKTYLKALSKFMEDFNGSHLDQHCISTKDMYEKLIREPANKDLKPGQRPLPPWNPATIKSHILYHTKDIQVRKNMLIYYFGTTAQYIAKNMIIQSTSMMALPGRAPHPSTLKINKEAVNAVKHLTDSMIKLVKLTSREIEKETTTSDDLFRSATKSAIIDPTRKTIATGNTSVGLDCYFHTSVLRLKHRRAVSDNGDDNLSGTASSNPDFNEDPNKQGGCHVYWFVQRATFGCGKLLATVNIQVTVINLHLNLPPLFETIMGGITDYPLQSSSPKGKVPWVKVVETSS